MNTSIACGQKGSVRFMGQSKKLFSKLDWFSGVFNYVSLHDLVDEFSVYFDIDLEFMMNQRYMSSSNTGRSPQDQVIEIIPGVQCRLPLDYFCSMAELSGVNLFETPTLSLDIPFDSIFDYKFPRLIFNCTGAGLDNLRELGYNVDENFRLLFPNLLTPEKGISFHVTRCDFAFDFINWGVDLPLEFDYFLHSGDLRRGLWYGNNKNPLITECRICSKQSTVYIGNSAGSNKILRIYDKLLQYFGKEVENVPLEYCEKDDEGNRLIPDSWVRIELQARREVAEKLLSGHDPNTLTSVDTDFWDRRYWAGILKWIADYYSPRISYGQPVADFWVTLFDWSLIEEVIQNAKYVSSKTRLERAESFCYRNSFSTFTLLSYKGLLKYLIILRNNFSAMQHSPKWPLLWSRLCSAEQLGCTSVPPELIKFPNGDFSIKDLDLVIEYLSERERVREILS